MKHIITALLLTLAGAAAAQPAAVYCRIDQGASEVSWSVTNANTGEVLASGSNQNNAQMVTAYFQTPPGSYTITVTDSGGDGWTRGMFLMTVCDLPMFMTLGNFTSQVSTTQTYTTTICPPVYCPPAPADTCPEDINEDGIVGVGDLIMFIAAFGSTCN
jgi:hypothetical protein